METNDNISERANILVNNHLHYVKACVIHRTRSRRLPPGVSRDDLLQAGCLALCEAALAFDSAVGCKFWTYAQHHVQGAISKAIRDGLGPVCLTEYAYRRDAQRPQYFSIEPYDDNSESTLPEEIQSQLCVDERDSIHTNLDSQKALAGLSEKDRKLVEQHFGFEGPGLTFAEIAQLEGKSQAAGYKKIENILAKVRKAMKN